jgi:enamine deaminase RidA (YjgF/YER057c/UK114 family)
MAAISKEASNVEKKRLMPKGHWDWSMPGPFTQGWRVGNMVFVGGQVSAGPDSKVIGVGDIEVQTRNTFENITTVLKEAGAEWRHVVKQNTYYVYNGPDEGALEFWQKMTRVRLEYFPDPAPCGTAVRVVGLADPDMLIEVEVIAIIDD